jgi:hypothetical protein
VANYQASGALTGALTTSDVTPPNPAHIANDILVCQTSKRTNADTCATPSGWSLLAGPVDQGTTWRTYWFYKRAASGSEANPLCDWGATSADKYGQVHSIRGAITTGSPFAASQTSTGTADPGSATGVTSTAANQLIISLGMSGDNLATDFTSVTATNPATFTKRHYTTITTGADAGGWFFDAVRTTNGATGNVSHDFNGVPLIWSVLVAAILDPGATNYTDQVDDSVGVTDAATGAAGYQRSAADTVGVTDGVAADKVTTATVSDSIGVGDSVAQVAAYNRVQAEAIGLNDAVLQVVTSGRSVDDLLALADVLSQVGSFARQIADGVAAADAISQDHQTGGGGLSRTVDDTVGVTDLLGQLMSTARTLADQVGVADVVVYVYGPAAEPEGMPVGTVTAAGPGGTTLVASPMGEAGKGVGPSGSTEGANPIGTIYIRNPKAT